MAQSGNVVCFLFLLVTSQLTENDAATASEPFDTSTQSTSFYCNVTFECSEPFTFRSENSLENWNCACREGWLTTRTCCLSQWWFIGLSCIAGGILLIAFIIVISCCCSYKSDAKKAKAIAKQAGRHSSHKKHNDIELHDSIKSPHHVTSDAPMATFAANDHDTVHSAHAVEAHHVAPAHVTPAHAVEAHHVAPAHAAPASHDNDHVAPVAAAHPVATAAAVAVVVHEANDNQHAHPDPTPVHHAPVHDQPTPHVPEQQHHPVQPQSHSTPQHQYQYNNGGPPYNRYAQPAYQGHSNSYYPPNRQAHYGGYANPHYSEDNDSLETYDDTALPSTNYNNYNSGPGYYNYGGQNGSSNNKKHTDPNSSLLKIDSTSQFVINRPKVIL